MLVPLTCCSWVGRELITFSLILRLTYTRCGSACKKNPVMGVIGV